MDSKTIYHLILILAVLFFSLLFLLIPLKYVAQLTIPFSFKTFGIRKIRRWHSRTDTLANLFLWISVILAFAFPFIPEARLAYGIWLTFTWLCTLSRAVRLSQIRKGNIKLTVIFMLNLIYGFGMLSGLGLLDDQGLWIRSETLVRDLSNPEAWQILYLLRSPNFMSYLLQAALMVFTLCTLWSQFKYMRLENTYKARFLATYIIRNAIAAALILGAGVYGLAFLEDIYQVEANEKLNSTDQQETQKQEEPSEGQNEPAPEHEKGGLENPAPEAESHPEEQLENLPESQPEEQPENPEPVPVE